eukprot:11177609-Lingulodinium_polyedra.AAC.1
MLVVSFRGGQARPRQRTAAVLGDPEAVGSPCVCTSQVAPYLRLGPLPVYVLDLAPVVAGLALVALPRLPGALSRLWL